MIVFAPRRFAGRINVDEVPSAAPKVGFPKRPLGSWTVEREQRTTCRARQSKAKPSQAKQSRPALQKKRRQGIPDAGPCLGHPQMHRAAGRRRSATTTRIMRRGADDEEAGSAACLCGGRRRRRQGTG